MKKISLLTLALLAVSVAGKDVKAAQTDGSAEATILATLSISQNTEMNFGTIAPDGTDQTVTISSAGVQSDTGPDVYVYSGTPSQGVFDITNQDGATDVNIVYGDGILSDGTNTIALDVSTVGNPTQIVTGDFTAGAATLNVAGSIDITAATVAGTYTTDNASGSPYSVTVSY